MTYISIFLFLVGGGPVNTQCQEMVVSMERFQNQSRMCRVLTEVGFPGKIWSLAKSGERANIC